MIPATLPNLPLAMWRDSLQTGDEVGVYDAIGRRLVHKATVRRTPGSKLFIEAYGRLDWMQPTVSAPGFGERFVGPLAPERFFECAKYGCRAAATTVELNPAREHHPNCLCREHAERPEKPGTFEAPTVIT